MPARAFRSRERARRPSRVALGRRARGARGARRRVAARGARCARRARRAARSRRCAPVEPGAAASCRRASALDAGPAPAAGRCRRACPTTTRSPGSSAPRTGRISTRPWAARPGVTETYSLRPPPRCTCTRELPSAPTRQRGDRHGQHRLVGALDRDRQLHRRADELRRGAARRDRDVHAALLDLVGAGAVGDLGHDAGRLDPEVGLLDRRPCAPGRTSLASLIDSDESIARRELLTVITRPGDGVAAAHAHGVDAQRQRGEEEHLVGRAPRCRPCGRGARPRAAVLRASWPAACDRRAAGGRCRSGLRSTRRRRSASTT